VRRLPRPQFQIGLDPEKHQTDVGIVKRFDAINGFAASTQTLNRRAEFRPAEPLPLGRVPLHRYSDLPGSTSHLRANSLKSEK